MKISPGQISLVFTFLLFLNIAHADIITTDPPIQPFKPELPDLSLLLMPPASTAYNRECADRSPTHHGDIFFNDTNKIDVYRCIRYLYGSLTLSAEDNRFHQVGLPYLYHITGFLKVEGKAVLDEFYLPTLKGVGGNITIDTRMAFEYLDMPAVKRANKLTVIFRSNNVDLNGLNSITQIDRIELDNFVYRFLGNADKTPPLLNGLQNLTRLNELKITGGSVGNYVTNNDPGDGGFLESLTEVNGDVSIDTSGTNFIYGLGNISHVKGDFEISDEVESPDDSGSLGSLAGMEKLNLVDGHLHIHDINSLTSLSGLNSLTVGQLTIENNPNLTSLSGLINGNTPQVNIAANGSVTIRNNSNLSCSEITAYTGLLSNSVNINTPGC